MMQALRQVVNIMLIDPACWHSSIFDHIYAVIVDQLFALINTQSRIEKHPSLLQEMTPVADWSNLLELILRKIYFWVIKAS